MAPPTSEPVCVEARKIDLDSSSAIVGIFSQGEQELVIRVCTKGMVYQTTVDVERLPDALTNGHRSARETLMDHIMGRSADSFSCVFYMEGPGVEVSVREQVSGITRMLWSTRAMPSNLEPWSFSLQLVDAMTDQQKRFGAIQESLEAMQKSRNEWRDTAEGLQGHASEEKTSLLRDFLKLYQLPRATSDDSRGHFPVQAAVAAPSPVLPPVRSTERRKRTMAPLANARGERRPTPELKQPAPRDDSDSNTDDDLPQQRPVKKPAAKKSKPASQKEPTMSQDDAFRNSILDMIEQEQKGKEE